MMNFDGSKFKVLVYAPINVYFESPRFSPDGRSIVYLSIQKNQNREYETMDICILNLDQDSLDVIYHTEITGKEWSDPSTNNSIWVCWSPDGSKLLFSKPVADFTSYLYAIKRDGSELTQVTTLEGVTDTGVSWSK